MMINADNEQVEEVLELFEKLNISTQNRTLAIPYMKGETGDEVLDQFEPMRFAIISHEIPRQVEKLMNTSFQTRLFNVLFAIGHGSCVNVFHRCLSEVIKNNTFALYKRFVLWMDSSEKALTPGQRQNMLKMAQNSPEVLKSLVEPLLGEEGQRYALNVLSVYFSVKYPNADSASDMSQEDAALMEIYENLLLGVLHVWLVQKGYGAHQ